MKSIKNIVIKSFAGAAVALASLSASAVTNWAANGPSLGTISQNAASSLVGISAGFEAFIYLLGFVFLVLFFLGAWKYKKSEGRDGNMGLIVTYLVLCVCAFAAPTVVGSGTSTIFGSAPVTRLTAPSPQFSQ